MTDLYKYSIGLVFAILIFAAGFYSGYSYRDGVADRQAQKEQSAIQDKQQEVNKQRQETNDSIIKTNSDVSKQRQENNDQHTVQTVEVIKYVQSPAGAVKCIDDNFVQQYNKSLPN